MPLVLCWISLSCRVSYCLLRSFCISCMLGSCWYHHQIHQLICPLSDCSSWRYFLVGFDFCHQKSSSYWIVLRCVFCSFWKVDDLVSCTLVLNRWSSRDSMKVIAAIICFALIGSYSSIQIHSWVGFTPNPYLNFMKTSVLLLLSFCWSSCSLISLPIILSSHLSFCSPFHTWV